MQIENTPVEQLIPYANNSRTHSDAQVAQIAASIREYGFNNPVLIDESGSIIAGHGRVLAARKLQLTEVPTIRLSHLTDVQKRAYVIVDNQLALNAGWDEQLLSMEIQHLSEMGHELALLGFDPENTASLLLGHGLVSDGREETGLSENYSRKIEAPIYEITGDCPAVSALYNTAKTDALKAAIDKSKVANPLRNFLLAAAERHTVFNFDQIAEFYAHAEPEIQKLMEDSALVIIDFDAAIENGFVSMSTAILSQQAIDEGLPTDVQ